MTFTLADILRILEELDGRTITKDYAAPQNVNPKICSQCGGACCKRCGCHYSPDDFEEISFEYLKTKIEKGYISIEYIDAEMILQATGVYILRIRNQDAPIVDNTLRRTPCILLTESGCKLDYDNRPAGGKLLVPHPNGKCQQNYHIEDCCHEWRPHQKVLHALAQYFADLDIPCSI